MMNKMLRVAATLAFLTMGTSAFAQGFGSWGGRHSGGKIVLPGGHSGSYREGGSVGTRGGRVAGQPKLSVKKIQPKAKMSPRS
jgi:hypothetical protein